MMCFTYVYVRMCYNIFWCYHKPPKKDNPFITQHCSLRAPGTKTWPWPSWQWKSDAAWPLWRSNETALFYGLLQKTTGLYSKNWFIMFILTSKCQNMGPFKKQCVGCSLLEWQHLKSWHPSWHHCPKKCVQTFFDQSLVFLGIFGSAMFRTCPRVRCFLKRDVGDAWKLHKMQTAQGGGTGAALIFRGPKRARRAAANMSCWHGGSTPGHTCHSGGWKKTSRSGAAAILPVQGIWTSGCR